MKLTNVPAGGNRPATAATRIRRDWRARLPFFYGWLVVAGSFVSLGISYAAWYSFSVFYVALLEEFGWTRAASAGVFSVFVIMNGLGGAASGLLADRLGPGRVATAGVVVLAAGLVACSQVRELWQLYLFFGVVTAIGSSTAGWVPAVTMIGRWFSARLGVAMGVASAGIGLGIMVMVPLVQLLIGDLGWRSSYLVLAAIAILGVAPISLLVMRGRPEDLGLPRDGRVAGPNCRDGDKDPRPTRRMRIVDHKWASRDWTIGMALTTRRYWLLFAAIALNNVAMQMVMVHQVALLVDGGYDRLLAASVVGFVGLFSVGTKIGAGWVSDRIGRETTWTIGIVGMLLALALLVAARLVFYQPLLYLYAFAFAITYGVAAPLAPATASDLFGGRHYGSIYGTMVLANAMGSAVGTLLGGFVYDLTGGYIPALAFGAATSSLSVGAMWLAAPRKVRSAGG